MSMSANSNSMQGVNSDIFVSPSQGGPIVTTTQDEHERIRQAIREAKIEKKIHKLQAATCKTLTKHFSVIVVVVVLVVAFGIASPLLFSEEKSTRKLGGSTFTMLLMVPLWITEAIPLGVTAFVPVVTGPLFGVTSSEQMLQPYMRDIMMLFFGGIAVALAFEYSNLHRRIALRIILMTGTTPLLLILGIMLTTSTLSMFMNNTSVTAMMVPIVVALCNQLDESMHHWLHTVQNNEATQGEKEDQPEEEGEDEGEGLFSINSELSTIMEGGASSDSVKVKLQTQSVQPSNPTSRRTTHMPNQESPYDDTMSMSQFTVKENISITSSQLKFTNSVDPQKLLQELSMIEFLQNTRTMLLLATCYSANTAGTAVIVGSGTNLVLLEKLSTTQSADAKNVHLGFLNWSSFAIVPMLINETIILVFLYFWFLHIKTWWSSRKHTRTKAKVKRFVVTKSVQETLHRTLMEAYLGLGKITLHETITLIIFFIMVFAWIFLKPSGSVKGVFPGWIALFPETLPSLSTVAVVCFFLLFSIPRNPEFYRSIIKADFKSAKYDTIMDWRFFSENYPYGVFFLLGGGFALSDLSKYGGLNEKLRELLQGSTFIPKEALLLIVIYMAIFLTEVASNTAIANIFVPVLLTLSESPFKVHPLYFAFAVTIACSHAFMLPVSTPPNAIAFSAGKMRIPDMLLPGLCLNFLTGVSLYVSTLTIGDLIFGFSSFKGSGKNTA